MQIIEKEGILYVINKGGKPQKIIHNIEEYLESSEFAISLLSPEIRGTYEYAIVNGKLHYILCTRSYHEVPAKYEIVSE